MSARRIPRLPQLLERKIYKTGQTRGADDDVIFQNRVSRAGNVLIPYSVWTALRVVRDVDYENGFIVLIPPSVYFGSDDPDAMLARDGLLLGENALLFYELRSDWQKFNPDALGLKEATSRQAPLGGKYVARVAGTTALNDGGKINRGFTATTGKGAGIRLYEYANAEVMNRARLQLEAVFWHCVDAVEVITTAGMSAADAIERRAAILEEADRQGLLAYAALQAARILNVERVTVCPLCLIPLSAKGFLSRLEQAEGRAVHDLTVTEVNLFHIEELRFGVFNHRPYNLGWGHHHCNVVVKDSGIQDTLIWMAEVLQRNEQEGH